MDLGISGKRALVTGSSSGLGLMSAKHLAAEGVQVCRVSRSLEKLQATADQLMGDGNQQIAADVSEIDSIATMIDEAEELLGGPIDILVPNAGGPPVGTFASTELSAYNDALQLSLMSNVAMCKRAIPSMQERGWGRVIAITSASVRQPIDSIILSNTARAGLTGFLKTTATEVAKDGVTVNSVQPGVHLTDRAASVYGSAGIEEAAKMLPAGRLGDPDDFGAIVTFLCSQYANYITGAAIPVEGGWTKGLQ